MANAHDRPPASLLQQAAPPHLLNHQHQHQPLQHHHLHLHARYHLDELSRDAPNHARSPDANANVQPAADPDRVVVATQTVSVIHVVDETGSVLGITTIAPPTPTPTPAPVPAPTPEPTPNLEPTPTLDTSVEVIAVTVASSLLATDPAFGHGASSSASAPAPTSNYSASLYTDTISPTVTTPLTTVSSSSSTPSGFLSLTGIANSTISHSSSIISNSTTLISLFHTNTSTTATASSFSASLFLSPLPSVTSNSLFSPSSSTADSSSFSATASATSTARVFATAEASATTTQATNNYGGGVGSPGGNGDGGAAEPPSTSGAPSSDTDSSSGLTPAQQGAVVGGVLGGVAGIALIAFVLMFLLKWKRGQMNRAAQLLGGGDGPSSTRALPSGPQGGGGPAGGMTDHSLSFVPGALAALVGHKRTAPPSPPASAASQPGERGFYRVSGKKLTSVLQSGGDGYDEPAARDSMVSAVSYRDSMAFFGAGPSAPRFKLGSPMRPESGLMVVNPGPARTPVQEQGPNPDANPFADPPSPPPPRGGIGQSFVSSRDGSRGSGTRFTEDV